MAKILFDCAILSRPYGLKRCTFQLMHLAMVADRLGHDVRILSSRVHNNAHKFIHSYAGHLVSRDVSCRQWADIYVAKGDAYYKDHNWDLISGNDSFKVCLCNSDKCFRESNLPYKNHRGTSVLSRCDLYMPVNHTDRVAGLRHVVPVVHPVDPRMIRLMRSNGLYEAYLDDEISRIRGFFHQDETRKLGFMGSREPKCSRDQVSHKFPKWVDFRWSRKESSRAYITWVMKRRGCLDLRGYGDKSLRFTEAAMLGRTVVTSPRVSKYEPPLTHGHNCIIYDDECSLQYDRKLWLAVAENATNDYLSHWSMRAQMQKIIAAAGA